MENDVLKRKSFKKPVLITLVSILLICVIIGGWFLYRYLFPTDKELFVLSHANTIEYSFDKDEPEQFYNTTNVYFSSNEEINSQRSEKMLNTTKLFFENIKLSDDRQEYNMRVNFMDNELLTANAVEFDEIEVLTIPQLADTSYGADSYEDVLSLLFGSDNAKDIEIFENTDEKQAEMYLKKYLNNVYNSVPESDFTSHDENGFKVLSLRTDLNRTLYNTLTEIKNDIAFRKFSYEQYKIICENVNKKIPYAGTLIIVPEEDEYNENYEKKIDAFIKNIENATLSVTAKINKKRQIVEETISILRNEKEQYFVSYTEKAFAVKAYQNDDVLFEINSDSAQNGETSSKKTEISFDINDILKEDKAQSQMITMTVDSLTNTDVTKDITLPENYVDIRTISEEEKTEITSKASENFMALVASLTLELIS